jgi:hypothetical protein
MASSRFSFGFKPSVSPFDAHGDDFFEEFFFVGHELMQRRVDQADDDGIAVHRFEQTVEVLALMGSSSFKAAVRPSLVRPGSCAARWAGARAQRTCARCGTADTLGAVRAGAAGILRIIGICPHLQTAGRPARAGASRTSLRAEISSAHLSRVINSFCSSMLGRWSGSCR